MLKTRVITAVILVAGFVAALFYVAVLWWSLLTLAAILLAAHEWSRLWWFEPAEEFGYLVALTGTGALILFVLPPHAASTPSYVSAVAFWFIGAPLWLYFGWQRVPKWLAAVVGALIFVPTWLAMLELRAPGPVWLLAAMVLVWVADIAAYFAGRAFGRHQLAPSISPGKTWEGVAGGLVGVLLYTVLVVVGLQAAAQDHAGFDALAWSTWLMLALVMGCISIIGDLFESAVKRLAGVKDSSAMLPGHGGVLDRIDALLPVLPLAALIFT